MFCKNIISSTTFTESKTQQFCKMGGQRGGGGGVGPCLQICPFNLHGCLLLKLTHFAHGCKTGTFALVTRTFSFKFSSWKHVEGWHCIQWIGQNGGGVTEVIKLTSMCFFSICMSHHWRNGAIWNFSPKYLTLPCNCASWLWFNLPYQLFLLWRT